MTKDYKQSSRPKPGKTQNGSASSILAGLLIGLCIGVAFAVGAALYINKSGVPFFGKTATAQPAEAAPQARQAAPTRQPEALTPQGAKGSLPLPGGNTVEGAKTEVAKADPAGGKVEERFKFYDILSGNGDNKPAAAAKPPTPLATPPVAVPAKGSYLQIGAFHNETEADNLKAKVAMMGMEAGIQTSDVPGKGVMHRVRIGPLAKAEDIDRTRAQLKVNGIDSAIVKN